MRTAEQKAQLRWARGQAWRACKDAFRQGWHDFVYDNKFYWELYALVVGCLMLATIIKYA